MIRDIYLSSRNELEPDVLVRLVDKLGVEPHVAMVVLQAVALQHLDHGIMGRRFPDGGLLRYRK